MPFFNKLGETIWKATQAVTSAAKDTSDGFRNAVQAAQNSASQQAGEAAGKCPNCGQPHGAMQVVCPLCGFELQMCTSFLRLALLQRNWAILKEADMLEMRQQGIFTPDSLVWKSGIASWVKAESVPELAAVLCILGNTPPAIPIWVY